MSNTIIILALGLVAVIVVGGGILVMIAKFFRKVDQGQALIINKMRGDPTVTFSGGVVIPIVYRAEVMDISVKTIELERRGSDGLICKDNIRADIKVAFFVKVNKTAEDVLKVAQAIGCQRASAQSTLEELFTAKFSEALKTVGKRLDFEHLYTQRESFRDDIIDVIGRDLDGYTLVDVAIDYLEQTPLDSLDPQNILDAQGIRKIVDITTKQNAETNELRQSERMVISKQNLEADEAILELDRRKAEAEAKQQREIAMVQAKEEADTRKFQSKQSEESEVARIEAEEAIAIADLNKSRQVEVADKDRERVVAIKTEEVEKDRQLEVISREREVELQRIEKEKALEVQRKEIADVVRSRIAVEKNVAEEEERIKDLRVSAEAERSKKVKVIGAEAEAEEHLVKHIKAAEAQEKVAEFEARQKLIKANADLEASDKSAKAKIRMAEGVQAEVAAQGLAEVKVKEANALALEKEGLAKARVTLEQMQAEAAGSEKKGLARIRVEEGEVGVQEKQGLVQAAVTKEKALAEAAGAEERGMVAVRLKEADAVAVERQGKAEATAIKERLLAEAAGTESKGLAEARAVQEKLKAEAAGLAEKAEAMKALEGMGREHEEFRLKLEQEKDIALASIQAKREIAEAQAKVLAEAFGSSEIRIVGGDGQFFDRFVKAASLGTAIDGFVDNSDIVRSVVGEVAQSGLGKGLLNAATKLVTDDKGDEPAAE
ncbi:MAG: hypothetical protein H6739_18345 [Alphaproteobacteria bacterium]|nr:hypothetical protein [Alphaproteobacteria bacterium]